MISAFSSTCAKPPPLHTAPTLLTASLAILRQPGPLAPADLYRALGYADDAYGLAVEAQQQQQPPHATAGAEHTDLDARPGAAAGPELRPPHVVVADPGVPLLRRCEALQSLCLGRLGRELGGADEARGRSEDARRPRCAESGSCGGQEEKEEEEEGSKKHWEQQQQQQQQQRRRRRRYNQPRGSGGSSAVAPLRRPSTVRFMDRPTAAEVMQGPAAAGTSTDTGVVGIRDVHGNIVAYRRKPQLRSKAKQSFDGWRNVV